MTNDLALNTRSSIKSALSRGEAGEVIPMLIRLPRDEWDSLLSPKCEDHPELSYNLSELQDLESALDSITQGAALLSDYIGHRGTYGCGDHGHDCALKYANKRLKKVRKALGYTSP